MRVRRGRRAAPPISKRERKLRRRVDNERLAKESRFWKKARSAIQQGHYKPVNRQAAKDLNSVKRERS
jgi:hypothetical protein